MKEMTFKAFSITNEIDLNKIAIQCGIPKKFTWEEPLILKGTVLTSILKREVKDSQYVLVFSFGSVVFINHTHEEEINILFQYIKSFEPEVNLTLAYTYTDDYSLQTGKTEEIELTDEYVVIPEYDTFYPEIISTVLAKSVALEKTEVHLGKINDQLEILIDRLEKGKMRIGNKRLAKMTAEIVRHEYNTHAYIMILDKPDITWTSNTANEFYDKMSEFFELNDRYTILKSKTETLYNIMDGFSNISHSIRGLFVEWVIVILILIEILMTVSEYIGWLP
ncbi:RMD1 family protein [Niallia endozanthoxylica]|uniref:RMD1 family protein n=1 Tax=Niallia endozanthoxylica TaxID=2036016 RepID=A0A5J5HHV3_9BACI|nr:RMD1 family protein [Niallia endozanthoxylica]KAA9019538.1 RMD1 family protein [Niallia endozanthoxylica]